MTELPEGGDANLRVYKYEGPILKRLWYALKAVVDIGRTALLPIGLYGEMPGGDSAPIKLWANGAVRTAPPYKEVVWNPTGDSIAAFDTLLSSVYDVEDYNYIFFTVTLDGGSPDTFSIQIQQSDTDPFVSGNWYYTEELGTSTVVDGDTVGVASIAQKLIYKYVRLAIINEGGIKTVEMSEAIATMVVQ